MREAILRSTAIAALGVVLLFPVNGATQSSKAPPFDLSRPIPFFIDSGNGVPGYVNSDRDLANMAFDAWSRESGSKLRFSEVSRGTDASIWIKWISAAEAFQQCGSRTRPCQMFGNTLRFTVGKTRSGMMVYIVPEAQRYDDQLSKREAQDPLMREAVIYVTCVHEIGHALGLGHSGYREDIMYSFRFDPDTLAFFTRYRANLNTRDDIARFSGLSPGDIKTFSALYPQ